MIEKESREKRNPQKFVGIYLGGGRLPSGEFKAYFPFGNDIPVAARVFEALNEAPELARVVVIAPQEDRFFSLLPEEHKPTNIFESSEKFEENLRIAFDAVNNDENAIVVFSDVPFIKPEGLSRLANSTAQGEIIVPAIWREEVRGISDLHNLHFNPSREGYFHLGNAALIRKEVKEKLDLSRLVTYYYGKSFRIDPKEKLRAVYDLAGGKGIAVAIRIWISANLQHRKYERLDRVVPVPKISAYSEILSEIFGINCGLEFNSHAGLFLDFDYLEDARQLQRNWKEIDAFMSESV